MSSRVNGGFMKKSKIRKAVRVLGSLALASTIASFALLTMTGCKKKKGYAVYNPPQATSKCDIGGNHFEPDSPNFSKCCNPDTTPILPMKDSICSAGQGGVAGSISMFSDSAGRATTSNTQAASLEQQQNPDKQNNQLAATASTSPPTPANTAKLAGSGLAALSTGSGNGSASRGGGGGGSGAGGGGGFGSGVNTQAAAPATVQTSATGDSANAGYSSSGGGGGAARAGSGAATAGFNLDSLFGAGKDGGAKTGSDNVNFSGNGVSEATMGTPDPELYFSMMSREDNIFKVVERRYQSKAQQWALKDAGAVQGAVSGRR